MNLLGDLLKWLFVPSEDFFNNNIEDIKTRISKKIPYEQYIDLFESVKNVESSEDIGIDLKDYKITNNLSISKSKFIDFSNITKYKETWYNWVRGFTFIFMVVYNINQITKFLRGINVADGANALGIERNNKGGMN